MGKERSKVSQKYQKSELFLCNGEWNKEVVRKVDKWKVQELYLFENKRSQLLEEIAHVEFIALIKLSVWGNNICSIEGLGRIKMPLLQELNITSNNIISVKEYRKCQCQFLSTLWISHNYIRDHSALTEGNLPRLKNLLVHEFQNKERAFNKCFPLKLQTQHLLQLYNSPGFAFTQVFKDTLRSKWQHNIIIH